MSSDSAYSTVSYTSISFEARSQSIPTMDPYEEIAQQGQETPLSPAYVPDPMELEHHIPVYIPEPDFPEYLALSDDDIPEDPIEYVVNADDDDDEEKESSEDDDDEEEEHLAPADSTAIASLTIDLVPFTEQT
ncbi:hypothetical protein Tco_0573686 [Tanacetum coccineum]